MDQRQIGKSQPDTEKDQKEFLENIGLWRDYKEPGVGTTRGSILRMLNPVRGITGDSITGARLTAARKRERRNKKAGRRWNRVRGNPVKS